MNKAEELWEKQMYKESTPVEVMEIHAIQFTKWVCDECTQLDYVDSPHRYKYHLTGQIHNTEKLYKIFNTQTK